MLSSYKLDQSGDSPLPLISVIIPVYNGETTIEETVNSVLGQTFTDFELIVINDGSEDSTLDILARINDLKTSNVTEEEFIA